MHNKRKWYSKQNYHSKNHCYNSAIVSINCCYESIMFEENSKVPPKIDELKQAISFLFSLCRYVVNVKSKIFCSVENDCIRNKFDWGAKRVSFQKDVVMLSTNHVVMLNNFTSQVVMHNYEL